MPYHLPRNLPANAYVKLYLGLTEAQFSSLASAYQQGISAVNYQDRQLGNKTHLNELTRIPPSNLQEFSFTRQNDEGSEFSFTLFDETAIVLESYIGGGDKILAFSYGMINESYSPLYRGEVTGYDFSLTPGGAIITVKGIVQDATNTNIETKRYKGNSIDEYIKQIAREEGWEIGEVEPCAPIMTASDETEGLWSQKSYIRQAIGSLSFIKQELAPYAVSKSTGEGGYLTYLESKNNRTKLYFHPPKYGAAPSYSYEFYYMSHRESNVIEFAPKFNGLLVAAAGGGTVYATGLDKTSNEILQAEYNMYSNDAKNNSAIRTSVDPKVRRVINTSSFSQDEMMAYTNNIWSKNMSEAYEADLTVVGYPNFQMLENLQITALNAQGVPHHSSGVYCIYSISDTISGGTYTTTLNLRRNSSQVGKERMPGYNSKVGLR